MAATGTVPPVTLASLMWDWVSAYAVGYGGDQWRARRRASGGVLAVDTLAGLKTAIEADYLRRQAPPRFDPGFRTCHGQPCDAPLTGCNAATVSEAGSAHAQLFHRDD